MKKVVNLRVNQSIGARKVVETSTTLMMNNKETRSEAFCTHEVKKTRKKGEKSQKYRI